MKIQCDVCNKEEASLFCSADEAALCQGCDHRIHHANKLAGKHHRFPLLHPSSKEAPRCDICQNEMNPPEPPMPPPKEPTFSCPVCIGPLDEETSTKCGHIFCKKCIKSAITAQNKCPTCRRRLTMKDIFRIYLPATN